MIFEHEIPSKSKLYFGESAKIKRQIETTCAILLEEKGFEEIVTPLFSYHQHVSFEDSKPLLKLHDEHNDMITLRADSTADVVRIVTKRIGRTTASKKWFYIQPAVSFPTQEQYQVGTEVFDGTFDEVVNSATALLDKLAIDALLQISNMKIPLLLNEKYGVDLAFLHDTKIEKILALDLPWISKLVRMHRVEDLNSLEGIPADIQAELLLMKEMAQKIASSNLVIAPLYYAKMRYYGSLTFRMFHENELLVRGGLYQIDDVNAAGFALYTDACINQKMKNIKA
ncbi:MAG: ATP phosphoribosyltransferase regulatory subunit, divergent variant (EC [uncultured Sulfurovum sp.]|uniref:ATP phosphoribosyltransferase regulatory subunit, divergent variant (EC) n=1 Tax=uncultured Sulfurovum sp. TaxID=269237 RepID=A0A6S6TXH2_9BACT|nr:MAG: ATP phosphoribosyltransferase regulatory subunit, divergent variant (EC [uncultured Sulfurovum sp.]